MINQDTITVTFYVQLISIPGAKYFVPVGTRVRGEVPGADRAQPQELGDDHAENQREEVSNLYLHFYLRGYN